MEPGEEVRSPRQEVRLGRVSDEKPWSPPWFLGNCLIKHIPHRYLTHHHQRPMGSKTSGKRKGAPAAAPKQLSAEGATNKRTPQSTLVDAAAGKDTYEPESVVAERLAKGVTQYQVKWARSLRCRTRTEWQGVWRG